MKEPRSEVGKWQDRAKHLSCVLELQNKSLAADLEEAAATLVHHFPLDLVLRNQTKASLIVECAETFFQLWKLAEKFYSVLQRKVLSQTPVILVDDTDGEDGE
jgi:hypothetical protein